jgi:arylsulfatase A-like enzyme
MSCAGDPDIQTPHIDRIAASGVRFTQAYCPSAICQASRVAMFAGQSCHTTGDYENSGLIADDVYSLVARLRDAGYQTAALGKMHFVPQWPAHGFEILRKGDFCDCVDTREENEYWTYVRDSGMEDRYDLTGESLRKGELGAMPSRLPLEMSQEYWLADVTMEFLEKRDPTRPFFCHMSFSRPHNPWLPSAPYDTMYEPDALTLPPTCPEEWTTKPFRDRDRWHDPKLIFYYPRMTEPAVRRALALYYGLISQLDAQIGRVLDRLESLGLAGNTIVVFTSDHGDFAGDHGIVDKGVPTLDGIWRVPLLVGGAGFESAAGQTRDQFVNLIDLMPTLLERAGVDVPRPVEGRSLAREIDEPDWAGRDAIFYEYRHVKTVRTRDHIMSYYSPGEERFREYAHSACWAKGGELYDLGKDPDQFHNRYDDPAYRDVRLELTEMLLEWFCNTERVHRSSVEPVPSARR